MRPQWELQCSSLGTVGSNNILRCFVLSKKLSHEYVNNYFKSQGCILLSDTYVNSRTKLDYICSCGSQSTITFSNFQKGQRCRSCGNERLKVKKIALSLREVRDIFKANGCILLSTEYHGVDYVLDYICSCGTKSKVRLKDFRNGTRCKACLKHELSRLRMGRGNPAWKEQKTWQERQKDRSFEVYKAWRKSIYKRDNYTCQVCGAKNDLQCHHLESYAANEEIRTATNNGITLCKKCHKEFHNTFGRKNNNAEQFKSFALSKKSKVIIPNPYQVTIFDCLIKSSL